MTKNAKLIRSFSQIQSNIQFLKNSLKTGVTSANLDLKGKDLDKMI